MADASDRAARRSGSNDPGTERSAGAYESTWTTRKTRISGLAEDSARGLMEDWARSRQSGANTELRQSVHYLVDGGQTPMCERREHVSVDIWVSTH